jgi:hypothetical protein
VAVNCIVVVFIIIIIIIAINDRVPLGPGMVVAGPDDRATTAATEPMPTTSARRTRPATTIPGPSGRDYSNDDDADD